MIHAFIGTLVVLLVGAGSVFGMIRLENIRVGAETQAYNDIVKVRRSSGVPLSDTVDRRCITYGEGISSFLTNRAKVNFFENVLAWNNVTYRDPSNDLFYSPDEVVSLGWQHKPWQVCWWDREETISVEDQYFEKLFQKTLENEGSYDPEGVSPSMLKEMNTRNHRGIDYVVPFPSDLLDNWEKNDIRELDYHGNGAGELGPGGMIPTP
jgi:hypothetical protein